MTDEDIQRIETLNTAIRHLIETTRSWVKVDSGPHSEEYFQGVEAVVEELILYRDDLAKEMQ